MARNLAILLLWNIAFVGVARADVVHFVNGDRLTGRLVEAEAGYIALDVANIGVVTVPVEAVEQVDEEVPAEDDAVRHGMQRRMRARRCPEAIPMPLM